MSLLKRIESARPGGGPAGPGAPAGPSGPTPAPGGGGGPSAPLAAPAVAPRLVTGGAARESFRAAEGRYTAGVGTVVEVETARTELVTAEVSLRQAQSDQWTTLVTLRRALGLPVIP